MQNNTRNPYIIGTPVEYPKNFFGRELLLKKIEDSLRQNAQFILLHGQRRIGKTSVLKNIPLMISQNEFLFVHCDLQAHGYSSVETILSEIISCILDCLSLDSRILPVKEVIDLDNISRTLRRLIARIDDVLGNRKLVLLLDEFDVVNQEKTQQALEVLNFLKDLVRLHEEVFVITVVGRYLNYMPNLVQSFRNAPFLKIDLLDNKSINQLITQPSENIFNFHQKTIEAIIKFSSGHPYYTQVLCHEIFNLASDESNTDVTHDYVEEVIDKAIESAEGGLGGFWHGLSIHEQVVIASVAEAQNQNGLENPLQILQYYGLVLTDSLETAIQDLIDKDFLNSNPIKIKVELVRRWLLKRHQLSDEIKNLEYIDEVTVNNLLDAANDCWSKNQLAPALNIYENVLQVNPNHFSSIVELAQKYIHIKQFEKALPLYDRVYKLNPLGYQQEFIQALNEYGKWLIIQKEYTKAKFQYKKILRIDNGNSLAQQKLIEIKGLQSNKNSVGNNQLTQKRLLILSLIMFFTAGLFGLFQWMQYEQFSKKISSGERTLFSTSEEKNSYRQQGLDSFKRRNYTESVDFFKESLKNNKNDPEILIYKNNALAIKQENPLVLAVVVPATGNPNAALEMLRGVAQAQHDFNKKNGLNDRLLKIKIADDSNNPENVQQLAQKLFQNQSILGIIGHNASTVTEKALQVYEQENDKIAVISPTSTSVKQTIVGSSVFFRTTPSDKATAQKLAAYASPQEPSEYASSLPLEKVIIFCNPDDAYSNSLREEFRVEFEKKGGEVLGAQCVDLVNKNLNIKEELRKIFNDNKAQAIVLFPDTRNINVAINIANVYTDNPQIPKLPLLGGDSLYIQEALGVEGLVLAVPWFRNTPQSKEFSDASENQWGGGVSWRTATSFDATQAFIESFCLTTKNVPCQTNDVSRQTVLANLQKVELSSDKTSGEKLEFNSNREIQRDAILVQVQKGNFVYIPD